MTYSQNLAECEMSLPAAVDLSTVGKVAVVINASGQVALAAAGVRPDGFLKNAPTIGMPARFNFGPGVHKVLLAGTVAVGDEATVDTSSAFIKAVSASGVRVGRFLDAGASGALVRLLVSVFYNGPTL